MMERQASTRGIPMSGAWIFDRCSTSPFCPLCVLGIVSEHALATVASGMGWTNRRGIAGLTTWRREISYSWVQMGAVPGRSKPWPFKYYALPKMTTLWRRYCECFNLHSWCGCMGCRTKRGVNVNVIPWVVANVKRNDLTQTNRSNRLCYRILAERRVCVYSWFSGRSI